MTPTKTIHPKPSVVALGVFIVVTVYNGLIETDEGRSRCLSTGELPLSRTSDNGVN